jgi:hypothetical protein
VTVTVGAGASWATDSESSPLLRPDPASERRGLRLLAQVQVPVQVSAPGAGAPAQGRLGLRPCRGRSRPGRASLPQPGRLRVGLGDPGRRSRRRPGGRASGLENLNRAGVNVAAETSAETLARRARRWRSIVQLECPIMITVTVTVTVTTRPG